MEIIYGKDENDSGYHKQDRLTEDIYDMRIKAPRSRGKQFRDSFVPLLKDGSRCPRAISLCGIDREREGTAPGLPHCRRRHKGVFLPEGRDTIDVLGPLGNGFPLKPEKRAFLIGGGIGIPPLLELAKALQAEQGPGREKGADSGRGMVQSVLGYRDSQMFLRRSLRHTDRSMRPPRTESAEQTEMCWMPSVNRASGADIIYACGPTPMLRALKACR